MSVSISPYLSQQKKNAANWIKRKAVDPTQQHEFHFDNVFSPEVSTPEIYHVIARPIAKAAMHGYNGTVFMYGQTTSGKTYTMLGTPQVPGILPCSVRDIFNFCKNDEEHDYKIWASYMEIYNEVINDLLVPGSSNLKVKDDRNYGVMVHGLKKQ